MSSNIGIGNRDLRKDGVAVELFPSRIRSRHVPAKQLERGGAVQGAWNPKTDSALIPIGKTARERTVRMHEATHAIFSGSMVTDLTETISSAKPARWYALQAIEDAYVHAVYLEHINEDGPVHRDEVASAIHDIRTVVKSRSKRSSWEPETPESKVVNFLVLVRAGAILLKGCSDRAKKLYRDVCESLQPGASKRIRETLRHVVADEREEAIQEFIRLIGDIKRPPKMPKTAPSPTKSSESSKSSGSPSVAPMKPRDEGRDDSKVTEHTAPFPSLPKLEDEDLKPEPKESDGGTDKDEDELDVEPEDSGDGETEDGSEDGESKDGDGSGTGSESEDSEDMDTPSSGSEMDGDGDEDSETPTSGASSDEYKPPTEDGSSDDVEDEDEPLPTEDETALDPSAMASEKRRLETPSPDTAARLRQALKDAGLVGDEDSHVSEHSAPEKPSVKKRRKKKGIGTEDTPTDLTPVMYVHHLDTNVPRRVKHGRNKDGAATFGMKIRPTRLVHAHNNPNCRLFKKRSKGGTVLIDASGSMSLTDADLYQIALDVNMGTVAYYSGRTDSKTPSDPIADYGSIERFREYFHGHLVIYADKGKIRRDDGSRLPFRLGCNLIDLHALDWLLKQPGPRYFVTDGASNGGSYVGGFTGSHAKECAALFHKSVQAQKVKHCYNLQQLREKMKGKR